MGGLTRVRKLNLYGSRVVRLPIEIGDMAALEELDTYTAYCLHWYPYEITRCRSLRTSRVSTRVLYGNFKCRPPFPPLPAPVDGKPSRCSVCKAPMLKARQLWISLRVATDVLPLLVHACSDDCAAALPKPPVGYVQHAHVGGRDLLQPKPR